jgi:dymeclin
MKQSNWYNPIGYFFRTLQNKDGLMKVERYENNILGLTNLIIFLKNTNFILQFQKLTNSEEEESYESNDTEMNNILIYKMNFEQMFEYLMRNISNEMATLLLYLLIHENKRFLIFVLKDEKNIKKIILEILKYLNNYNSMNEKVSSNHIYILIIVLLILTNNDIFNKKIFQIYLNNDDLLWFNDKILNNINLGFFF